MDKKIDFVIAWVDGSDENWLAEKNKYLGNNRKNIASSKSLYRDYDSLKYVFRSIEKYAPWVNNVYLVTYNQKPSWLNENVPNFKIVDHKDYIPEKYLPTFSSHVIELNFHRIKGLSDNFVYFNDDMILTSYCDPSVFFKNGIPCDSAIINATVPDYDDFFYSILNTNTSVINKHFNKKSVIKGNKSKWFNLKYGLGWLRTMILYPWHNFLGFKVSHIPSSLCKSTLETVWEKEYDKLDETCTHKFRTPLDVNQYVFTNWQIASGNFCPRKTKIFKMFGITELPKNFANYVKKKKYKMICINDQEVSDNEYLRLREYIIDELEKMFPEKSKFEK